MSASIIETSLQLLRHRWRALLVVAVLMLGPAVAATSLIEVLGSRSGAIVNGSVVAAHDHWTDVVLTADAGGTALHVTVPVLLAFAWFVALGVGLRVLAGSPLRAVWREFSVARLGSWLALGALLGALALLSLHASATLAGLIDGNSAPLGVIAALLCAYGLARLALAMPAMLVDGYDLPGSLRRAASITRGRALLNGTALILIGVVPPAVLPMLIDARMLPTGDTWIVDVIWIGVASLLDYLVVLAAFPLQAAVLVGAYRVALATSAASAQTSAERQSSSDEPTAGDDELETATARGRTVPGWPDDERGLTVTMDDGRVLTATVAAPLTDPAVTDTPALTRRPPRWVGVAGLTLLAIAPAVAGPAAVLANPRGLPVATIVHPEYGFSPRPLDLAVLADGTVVMVDELQATLCYDTHCTDLETLTMPCYGGGGPEPQGAGVLGCDAEGHLLGADIAPDGTLLAVTRGRGQYVRVFGCRLMPNADGQCQWSGASSLYRQPDLWQQWSMDVAALPGGGFAAVMVAPGGNDASVSVRLAVCDRVDCPQPTAHTVLTVPRPELSNGGTVAVTVDPVSGNLALGYLDGSDGSLWLGGCPPGCPDGPTLNRAGARPEYGNNSPALTMPSLQVVATTTGPVVVLGSEVDPSSGVSRVPLVGGVIACYDVGCTTSDLVRWNRLLVTAALAVDGSGVVHIVGSDTTGTYLLLGPVPGERLLGSSLVRGDVVAVAVGADGRLRIVLLDDHGLALVTCANHACTAP